MSIGKRIKLRREELHLSQETLAERLSTTRQTIYNWENGFSKPNSDNIQDLTKVLDCSYDYLLNEDDKSSYPQNEDSAYHSNKSHNEDISTQIIGTVKQHWRKIYIYFFVGSVGFLLVATLLLVLSKILFSTVSQGTSVGIPNLEMMESINEAKQGPKNIMTIFSCFIYGIGVIFAIVGCVLFYKDKKYQERYK